MSTISGLPAHPLLVHFLVVLTPLTAILAILCVVWTAARQRLVWLVAALAAVNLVLTPITAEAGEWLEHKVEETATLEVHEHLGKTMIYVSSALFVAAVLLAVHHVRSSRGKSSTAVSAIVAVLVVVIGLGATVQVFRIGHSGAESAWGDALTNSENESDKEGAE